MSGVLDLDYVILGAGPSGLTFAHRLMDEGETSFVIIEAESNFVPRRLVYEINTLRHIAYVFLPGCQKQIRTGDKGRHAVAEHSKHLPIGRGFRESIENIQICLDDRGVRC